MNLLTTAAENKTISDGSTVSLYEHPLPSFVEADLARIHGNVFSSAAWLHILGQWQSACAYVVSERGEASNVLLFRRESGGVHVLNLAISMREDEIQRFASTIFAVFKSVRVISFQAVQADIGRLPFLYQQFNCLEDIVLTLPATVDGYFSALGKNMRSSLKRYQKKIASDFPGFRHAVYENKDVSEQDIADIVALSSARMASKNQVSAHTDIKTAQLIRLVKAYGVVIVARIDGRICAGVICTHFEGNFFMHVIAHDPAYDEYRIGKLCCYFSICDAIGRFGKEYHFLWGRYEYKYRLLGVQRDLDRLVIYRSPIGLLLSCSVFFKTAWRAYGRRAKRWLLDEKRKNKPFSKLLVATWNCLCHKLR
jgi:hypothetical protein